MSQTATKTDQLQQHDQTELFAVEVIPPKILSPSRGRDELNLAEFPLSALSHRVASNQKTLEFSDTIWDRSAQQRVERKLTITAADKYGLPTALDDEVILGLVQLSKEAGFSDRTVTYSKYELIKLLGWREGARSYRRLSESLDRWMGVTLKYENAWWNPEDKVWMTESFHILERLTTAEDNSRKKRDAFVWNEVVYQSFQRGNLKALDLNLYKSLQSAIAKRLYRLLDKRFYRWSKAEFDLVELAHHKLGLSKKSGVGGLKQKLAPAIAELEKVGFIKPVGQQERYYKHKVGEWHVIFEKAPVQSPGVPELELVIDEIDGVKSRLEKAGVSPQKARRLATTYPEDYLLHKIDVLKYLIQTNPPSNPGGFLVKSIQDDYAVPPGFKSQEEIAAEKAAAEQAKAELKRKKEEAEQAEEQKRAEEAKRLEEENKKVDDYLDSLPSSKRDQVIQAAYDRQRNGGTFSDWIDKEGPFGDMARRNALKEYVLGRAKAVGH